MTSLRLLADDLTGALDTAAEFVALTGPVPTFWRGAIPAALPPTAAIDSGTRELDDTAATDILRALIHHLNGGAIAFKKVDSLFRGPTVAELVTCIRNGGWDYCVLAPAFPYQGRITRDGRQYAADPGGTWDPVSENLLTILDAQAGRADADLQPGITVFDAESDNDLRRIVASVRRCPHPVLWAGSGGLAQALAATQATPDLPPLPRPVLGLFGSDQSATTSQLAACEPHWTLLADGGSASAARIAVNLATTGTALASFELPANTPRAIAGEQTSRHINQLTSALPSPGSVIVAGGETLRSLCQSVGADSLEVQGRIVPGVACSIMRGGRWNGVTVVSKSGAFGHRHLLCDLLGLPRPGIHEGRAS